MIHDKMVETYYQLIKAGKRKLEDIPEQVPDEVKTAVKDRLAAHQGE